MTFFFINPNLSGGMFFLWCTSYILTDHLNKVIRKLKNVLKSNIIKNDIKFKTQNKKPWKPWYRNMKKQNTERQKPGFPKEYVENADLYKLVRTYSRNLRQRLILARKDTFYEKRAPKISPPSPSPYSVSFLSVLHQNKALHNFCKRMECLIVEHNMSLEYAPPVLNKIMTRRK